MELLEEMARVVIEGDEEKAARLAQRALDEGLDPFFAIENGFAKGMNEVGRLFENLEIFLPQVILAADAMAGGIEIFRSRLETKGAQGPQKSVVLGTIQGDVHDIGKNIVRIMLECNGFMVYDLGRDVAVNRFVEKVRELQPDIVGVSALMTTTMVHMPRLIENLKAEGLRDKVKVMVGGAPVLPDWAFSIGADACGKSAMEAVFLAKRLTGLE